jgi:uncharacterized protein YuzE
MASQDNTLDLDYDEQNDVLYASLGSPQATLSYEISKDIWLDYIPPNRRVLGVTVLNFSEHYPVANSDTVLQEAQTIVEDLLQRYPLVPSDQERVTVRMNPAPWLLSSSTATAGTHATPLTKVVGFVSHFDTLRIQGNRVASKDTVA